MGKAEEKPVNKPKTALGRAIRFLEELEIDSSSGKIAGYDKDLFNKSLAEIKQLSNDLFRFRNEADRRRVVPITIEKYEIDVSLEVLKRLNLPLLQELKGELKEVNIEIGGFSRQ